MQSFPLKAQDCCYEFELKDAVEICPPLEACHGDPVGQGGHGLTACKESAHTYTVFPNDPAYTYTWTVTGGTPTNFTGNPNVIVWGSNNIGFIKVVVSNLGVGGSCVDSLMMEICLIDGPNANFTLSPDTVCQNSPVNFVNTSSGGSVYNWDFGDGNTSTLPNPPDHSYSSPGTYIVTLTATDMGAGQWAGSQGIEDSTLVACGCTDTISKVVVVLPGEGPVIETDCCYGTVCPGDTSSFCTPAACSTYNWTATGGTIISGAGTSCIQVKWNSVYSGPTTVSLELPGCGSAPCPGTTTMDIPVLYPNLPILGPTTLCAGASGSYSLPLLPGTYYTWTVTGGLYSFNQQDRNTPDVNITFNFAGTYWVKCEYDNPLAGCNGADSVQVNVLPEYAIFGDAIVCEGNTTTYYGSGNANWSVSPAGPVIAGSPSSSVNITWAPPGTYTISATPVTPSLFCNAVATFNVEVIAKPVLNNIVGADSVCPCDQYTYGISSDVSGSPYVWSITNGTGNIHSEMGADKDSVIVEWTGPGPWELSVYQEIEISPGSFCQSLVKTLTIDPFLPPVITGLNTVCVDATENYSAGGSNPTGDFQWSISPSGQGTIQSGQGSNNITVLWHGPSATATLTVSTCSGTDSFVVTINGPPTAIASYDILPVFCLGDAQNLTLSTPFSGTYSYQWYENGILMPPETNSNLFLNIASYTSPGTYQYYVEVTENGCTVISNIINVVVEDCSAGGSGGLPGPSGCDVVAFFRAYVVCDSVYFVDKSYPVPPATITGYSWTVTSGPGTWAFSPSATNPNPTLWVSQSGTYTVKLTVTSSTGCTSDWTENVNILLPTADFTILPTPVCANSIATFTPIPNNPAFQYDWDFGDGTTSYDAVTQHAYSNPGPPPYYVTLIIQDEMGCIATKTDSVRVDSIPTCTITAMDTIFCPGDSVSLTACAGMNTYQWYKDGNAISGANAMTYYVSQHGEYWVQVSNIYGCYNNSDSIYIYMNSLPVSDISGDATICASASVTTQFYLSTPYNVDYSYAWSSIPAGASFSPPNSSFTQASIILTSFPAVYQFVVFVTDVNTGCRSSDTLCVTFFEIPPLSLPFLAQCEGNPVTLTPNPNDTSLYNYQWNTGETTSVITAIDPGFYSLIITDKMTGCSNSADAGFIFSKPDLRLFPLGCENICEDDSLHLYIPLPLNALPPNNTYPGAYPNISWYMDGNYTSPVGTGENLYYTGGNSGDHQFSVVVQNSFGCSDTAGVFCLAVDTVVSMIVSTEVPCGCDTTLTFNIVNASNGNVVESLTINDCLDTLSVCVNSKAIYDIEVSNGIVIHNAIINGNVVYPGGMSPFYIGSNAICCFAAADSLFVKITSPITYTSDVVWDNKYYIDDYVIVTVAAGSILDITNVDVVFGECAGIVFQDSSFLRANNSVFRPCNVDKTWKGLRFVGGAEFDNIINESTFKNAEVALYFQDGADGVISNNLFSNCNYGIRVEDNNVFDHPISGNMFVTEQFYPEYICDSLYSFINNFSTYGIYTTSSRLLHQVSHNEFINSWGTEYPRTYGVFQINGGGLFSENNFTDLSHTIMISSALFPTNIENNDIEVNVPAMFSTSAIFIDNSVNPIVEINNNTILNNSNQYNSFSAIYARFASNISIVNNDIDGFRYGIIGVLARNFQISNNEIIDCSVTGIYFYSPSNTDDQNFITCNTIKMRDFNNTRGLFTINITPSSVITNNCITDSYTSMDYRSFAGTTALPLIRNNFMYNYNYVGINVQGHSGNIGTNADPGINTLYSNDNSAIDINSTTSITVADNFGMFNISWPQVQITSNNPYHSTASCAHQIFNMPSQGNLNITYTCDHFEEISEPLTGSLGIFTLTENYEELLKSTSNQFYYANLILASHEDPDPDLLNEILNISTLSDNEEALLQYSFYYRITDLPGARFHLNQFSPENIDQADFKILRLIDMDIIEHGWESLLDETILLLEEIGGKETFNSNFAIALLNNTATYRDYFIDELDLPEVIKSDNVKHIGENENYLNIYPNPATDKAFIELIYNNELPGNLEIFDAGGSLIQEYTVLLVAGGIELDIQQLKNGFYFVTLSNAETGFIQKGKFVKMKH